MSITSWRNICSGRHFRREIARVVPFYKGIELVRANLMKMLERRGVKPIVTEGAKFDVDYHDALLLIPRSDVDPGSIIDEVSTGYLLHDRVIRHSKGIVASEADSPAAAEPSDA